MEISFYQRKQWNIALWSSNIICTHASMAVNHCYFFHFWSQSIVIPIYFNRNRLTLTVITMELRKGNKVRIYHFEPRNVVSFLSWNSSVLIVFFLWSNIWIQLKWNVNSLSFCQTNCVRHIISTTISMNDIEKK